jgi:hypothetical protein
VRGRVAYIIDENLCDDSKLEGILLKFLSRSGASRIKLKIEIF